MFFFNPTYYQQLQLHNPCDMNAKQINWRQFTVKLSKNKNCIKKQTIKKVKKNLWQNNQTNTFPPILNYLATVDLEIVSELS